VTSQVLNYLHRVIVSHHYIYICEK